MIIRCLPSWDDVKHPRILLRDRMQVVRQLGVNSRIQKIPSTQGTLACKLGGLDFNLKLFNEIMNTTMTESKTGIVGEAEQQLTSPTVTSTFSTPTLTFGEVGTTAEHVAPGYELAVAHGVGEMEKTELLERAILVTNVAWDVSAVPGTLYLNDIDKVLRDYTRNWATLRQFQLYRADYEITVRLNTNQFYFGALMVNLFPGDVIGQFADELAVLQPTIISASCAESVVASLEYPFPFAWKSTTNNTQPVYLSIRNLTRLGQASPTSNDAVSVQIWARFKNIRLSYPRLLSATPPLEEDEIAVKKREYEAQSASGKLTIKRPKKTLSNHPVDSIESGVDEVANALTSVASGTISGLTDMVSGGISDALGLISLLDKPDKVVSQTPMIIEAASDAFCADVEDTNVSVSVYKDRYVDPGKSRMPMSKAWTVSGYAQIPGLRFISTLTSVSAPLEIDLIRSNHSADESRIPLDWAYINSTQWRGSIKLMLQFFTSAFTSARYVLEYINAEEFIGWESDYTNGIARVIDVKGDTTEMIELPWLSQNWWTQLRTPRVRLRLISEIASTTPSVDAQIYVVGWVAGGDDIQFAWPRIPYIAEWPWREPPPSENEAQSSIQEMFAQPFPPIAEGCMYDVDQGLCTNEALGLITDLCKRYSEMEPSSTFDPTYIDGGMLDNFFPAPVSGVQYGAWQSFLRTYFGLWRNCFLYRSGGYKWREYPQTTVMWEVQSSTTRSTWGTLYAPPFDGVKRLTLPQVMVNPYGMIGVPNSQISIVKKDLGAGRTPVFVAARDDLQLGYPVLPQGLPDVYIPPLNAQKKGNAKRSSTKGAL